MGKRVLYTAMVLDSDSRYALKTIISKIISVGSPGWAYYGEHSTICLGSSTLPYPCRKVLEIDAIGTYCGVIAVRVSNLERVDGKQAHITIACDLSLGFRPKNSNLIKEWIPLKNKILLRSEFKEITN